MNSLRRLLGPILRDISRSFYVSIRLLPRRLREPVGLAYLLARATDTVADTANIPASVRLDALRNLALAIQGTSAPNVASPSRSNPVGSIVDLRQSFAPLQVNAAERTLIEVLPDILQSLDLRNAADRGNIRAVLGKITRAQTLDIERFGNSTQTSALRTASDLHEYTYLVAGCVGEFWTHLCFRYIDNFAERSENEMIELGKNYGNGLQLVNILRDAHVDLAHGRCYFPEEELKEAGLAPSEILQNPERLEPIYRKWLDEAERDLNFGMGYVRAVRHRRVRAATALPALIGMRTSPFALGGSCCFKAKSKFREKKCEGRLGWSLSRWRSGNNSTKCFGAFSAAVGLASRAVKITALLLTNRAVESLKNLKHVFPDFAFLGRRLVPQQIRGMIRDHQRRAVVGMPSAAQIPHRSSRAKQALNRYRTQRHDHLRLNNVDLFDEIWTAGLHLQRRRRPISKRSGRRVRPAFQDVRDVNVGPREAHRLDNFREQLTGASHERLALRVLIRARRFADEHQVGIGIADAENSLCSRAGEMRTFCANAHTRINQCQHIDL